MNGLLRNHSLIHKDVDQPLQRLHILATQQIIVHGDGDKVHKTAVEFQVTVDVPERILPVPVVQVRVAAEHLLDDAFDISGEVGREARGLASPVALLASELREGSGEGSRGGGDGSSGRVGGRGGGVTRGEGGA